MFSVDPVVAPLRPGATALKGGDLKLECKVLQGNPPPVVTWFKMGKPLAGKKFEGAKVSANETGGVGVWSMWIRDVAEEDKGEYTCVAHNIAGNVSQSTQLDVHSEKLIFSIVFILIFFRNQIKFIRLT